MARKLGEAFVEIRAKMDSLKAGLDQARSLTAKAAFEIADSLGLIETALQKVRNVGLGLTAGVTLPIVLLGKGFIQLGSEAEELENRFNITFGDMSNDVRAWSRNVSDAMGRGIVQTQQFVSTMNTMLKPVGLGADATAALSKELTQITFDMGSFNDIKPAAMFNALQSAMVGMPRQLLNIGINLKDLEVKAFAARTGIVALGEKMTEAQKTVARFGLLLERIPDQMGDAIRTGGAWANQLVRLRSRIQDISTNLGTSLLPTLRFFLRILNSTIVPLAVLSSEFLAASPILSVFTTVIIGLLAAIGPMIVATWAIVAAYIQWKISAFVLRGVLFALQIQIKGVTISNWLMNRSFVFTKAVASLLRAQFIRLKIALTSLAVSFKVTSLASISFASIWTAASGILAAGAVLVASAFRIMWAAILGPAGIAIIAITALVFLIEHLFAKKAMKGLTEETDALNKALKALSGGGGGDAAGGASDLGRTVSTPVLANISAGGEGFSRIFGGLAGSLGLKPKGDQLVAGKLDRTNELLMEIVGAGTTQAVLG